MLLLLIAIALSFAFQYGVAPALQPDGSAVTDLPRAGEYLVDAWTDGCTEFETSELQELCSGNSGVFRVAGSTVLFFFLAGIGAICKPTANREAWPAKYVLFLFLVAATIFVPNEPYFNPIFLNIGRVGGVCFVLLQQIIILDFAYNLNESWVEKADKAEMSDGEGTGKKWLFAILFLAAVFFLGSIAAIIVMFLHFSGCTTNNAFIAVTLAMSVVVTAIQLMGEEASLLTSACVVAYATYLCFTAVSKNPDESCNPKLGEEDVLGIVLGVGFALLSITWAGWSITADKRLSSGGTEESTSESDGLGSKKDEGVKGVVTNQIDRSDEEAGVSSSDEGSTSKRNFANSWKLNFVMILVTCWFAMALTGWGSIESGGSAANPDVSRISMWLVIGSQWTMLTLYIWSMIAPILFPNRDFS